jgi:preprotein translocase SecE subunit
MAALEKIRESRTFIEESWGELQKVTWPDYEQLKNATLVVIVFVILISAVIWLMDIAVRSLIGPDGLIMRVFGA